MIISPYSQYSRGEFKKYELSGPGYHWRQVSPIPTRRNAVTLGRYQKCISILEEKLGSLKNKFILDMGCGDGVLTYRLFQKGALCYGIDVSEEAIGFARAMHSKLYSSAIFFIRSCYQSNFKDNIFDAVISTDVIEHLHEPKIFLSETKRVLKPGGIALISTPVRVREKPISSCHVREWFESEYKDFIGKTFAGAEFEYSHPIFWWELMSRSRKARILINLISLFRNPFLCSSKWRINCMQYAIVKKCQ